MEMVYNEERGTWNLFNGAEWYAEGTYEQMSAMMDNIRDCELEEEAARFPEPESDYYGDEDYDDYGDGYYDDPWTNYDRDREI